MSQWTDGACVSFWSRNPAAQAAAATNVCTAAARGVNTYAAYSATHTYMSAYALALSPP